MVQPLVRAGRLLPLLPLLPLLQEQFASERIPIYAVMLQARQRLPRIRACIDYWAGWLADMAAPASPSARASS